MELNNKALFRNIILTSYIQIHDCFPLPEKKSIGQMLYPERMYLRSVTEMLTRMCKRQEANKIDRFSILLKQLQFRLHYVRHK